MKKIFLLPVVWLLCTALVLALPKTKVACVGNSITYGMTLDNPASESYPAQLQQLLGDKYEVGNFGKSGATLLNKGHRPYMQQDEYRQAMDFAGDIVVIHLGINDTDPRNWPNYRDYFVADYLALIDSFRTVNPDCRILVARLTPISDRHRRFESGTRDWRDEIQQAIETVARRAGAQLLDFEEPLDAYPYILHDALHPNKEGAAILAQTVYSAITGDYGGLQMPPVYTDNMVLQRNRPLQISGMANAGEQVTVSIGTQKWVTKAADNGKWSVTLQPLVAGETYTLSITAGARALVYRNVVAGEVWLCSGQSNMEFYLKRCATGSDDIPQAGNSNIRLFDMKDNWRTDAWEWPLSALDSVNHLQYYKTTQWVECSSETAANFSAVAYYFGKMLQDSLHVPVGLICNAVGGSPAEAWVDRYSLEHYFPAILRDWPENDFIQDWVRDRAKENTRKSANKLQRHPYEPCYLFEAAIRPLGQFPIQGVIWYQGESNAHNREAHERLFPLLVAGWRAYWNRDDMPFYFVQLSGMARPSWPWFRDSQRRLMQAIPETGMAVCTDYGDSLDVHPRDKKPVGERLARWALNQTYGWTSVVPSGPLFREAECRDGVLYVRFDYGDGLHSSDGQPLRTFEVAEEEGLYEPAVAEVTADGLKVYSPRVKQPRYVRYAWQPFTRANLVNAAGLPASTFRAELPVVPVKVTEVRSLQGFPARDKAFAKGVSACFAGITGGKLLMAGGCNFPKVAAKDGGSKQFYRDIYVADYAVDSVLAWRKVAELPYALAYGVSVSTADGVVCIGGTDGRKARCDVFRLAVNVAGRVVIEPLPALPCALDNMSGAVAGNKIYVVGGNMDGVPCNAVYNLDLANLAAGWQRLPDFPGSPRTQPVCVALQGSGTETALYLWGGFAAPHAGRPASLSVDGYVYSSATGTWCPLPAPVDAAGDAVSLGGGTAVALSDRYILCMGGVDKEIFLQALRKPAPDYLHHPAAWYRFNQRLMLYDVRQGTWSEVARIPQTARAGAVLVPAGDALFYVGGELKPGVRAPSVLRLSVAEETAVKQCFIE